VRCEQSLISNSLTETQQLTQTHSLSTRGLWLTVEQIKTKQNSWVRTGAHAVSNTETNLTVASCCSHQTLILLLKDTEDFQYKFNRPSFISVLFHPRQQCFSCLPSVSKMFFSERELFGQQHRLFLTALWNGTKWTKIIEPFLKLFGKYTSAQLSLGSFQSKIKLDRNLNSHMYNCISSFSMSSFLFGVENKCNLVGKDSPLTL